MEQKTHFRKLFNPLYLGSHDLEFGKEYTLTIQKIEKDVEVIGDQGKKQKKAIIYFEKAPKPMILNSTNAKMIAKVLNTKFVEDWYGKQITLKVVQEKSFGELMDVIRVLNK